MTASSPAPRDCKCGHAFERHLGYVGVRQDPCAGGTPGFCGCNGYEPAPRDDTGVREALRLEARRHWTPYGGPGNCGCGMSFDGSFNIHFADALLPTVQRLIDQGKAEAWDDGYAAAEHDAMYRPYSDQPAAATWKPIPNPHRAALDPTEGRR